MSLNIPLGYFYEGNIIQDVVLNRLLYIECPNLNIGAVWRYFNLGKNCILEATLRVREIDGETKEGWDTDQNIVYTPDKIFIYHSNCYYERINGTYVYVDPLLNKLKEMTELLYAMQFAPGMPAVKEAQKRFEENSTGSSLG